MDLGGALFGGMALLLAIVLLAVYLVSRSRGGRTPDHAEEHEHTGATPSGDEDPVPRESGGGMPMVTPREPDDMSVDELQDRARRNTG